MLQKYHGIDFHARQITIDAMIDGHQNVRTHETVGIEDVPAKYIPKLDRNTYVCLESLTGSFEFATLLKPYVKDVFVLNSVDIKRSNKKTDKVDAEKLSSMLRYYIETNDTRNFPMVYIPPRHVSQMRSLFASDKMLKRNIISLKNRIHNIFKSYLIVIEKDMIKSDDFDAYIDRSNIPTSSKMEVRALKAGIDVLHVQRVPLHKEIIRLGNDHFDNEIRLLISIAGVSAVTACAIMADIGDIGRFSNHKKFASYLRSAPSIRSSDTKVIDGPLAKRGRKTSYELLLQGIQHVINSAQKYRDFYAAKTIGKKAVKVRAAMVRKIIVVIFYMLKNKELYRFRDEVAYKRKIKAYERAIK